MKYVVAIALLILMLQASRCANRAAYFVTVVNHFFLAMVKCKIIWV